MHNKFLFLGAKVVSLEKDFLFWINYSSLPCFFFFRFLRALLDHFIELNTFSSRWHSIYLAIYDILQHLYKYRAPILMLQWVKFDIILKLKFRHIIWIFCFPGHILWQSKLFSMHFINIKAILTSMVLTFLKVEVGISLS